jgi:hypothetical protein
MDQNFENVVTEALMATGLEPEARAGRDPRAAGA